MGKPRQNALELFLSHVHPSDPNECWLWQGGKRGRYGAGRLHGRTQGAHCVSYQLFVGEIPDGLEVMHECDVPLCVNPAHLKLGTHQQNIQDAAQKGRLGMNKNPIRGSDVAISKLTADQVIEIKQLKTQGYSHRKIGALFGVSNVAIFKIVHGLMWAHLNEQTK